MAAVLLHAGGDLLNVGELRAQPHGIGLAGRALLRRSLRRGGHEHQREAEEDGKTCDRSQTRSSGAKLHGHSLILVDQATKAAVMAGSDHDDERATTP